MTTGIVTAKSGLNVRLGPSTQHQKIGALKYNASVTVTGSKNGWYAIAQSGQTGYVSASFVNITGGATAAVPNTASASGTACTVTADALNVRAGAGTGYGVLGTLRKGECVTTVGQSGSWLKIFFNGQTGWIAQKYVAQTGGTAAAASSATETSSGSSGVTSSDSTSVVGPGAFVTGNSGPSSDSTSVVGPGAFVTGNSGPSSDSTSVVGPGAFVTGNSGPSSDSTSVVGSGASLTGASAASSSSDQTQSSPSKFSSAEIPQIKSWYQRQNYTKDFIRKMQSAVGTAADGSIGSNTINAVVAWQESKNLAADGKFGKSCAAAAGLTIEKNADASASAAGGYYAGLPLDAKHLGLGTDTHNTDRWRLHPALQEKLAKLDALIAEHGLPFRFFEGMRSPQRQDMCHKNGTSKLPAWKGRHNYGFAADYVKYNNGDWIWDSGEEWTALGNLGQSVGLNWGGSWTRFVDLPHFELPNVPGTEECREIYRKEGLDGLWSRF